MPSHKHLAVTHFSKLWTAQCEQIILCAKSIQRVEEEIEIVHLYRIAIRKARSLLVFMKPLLRVAFFNQVNDQLKEFANYFSKVREWDVLLEYYQSTYLEYVNEDKQLTEYLLDVQRKNRLNAYSHYDVQVIVATLQNYIQDFEVNGFKHKAKDVSCIAFVKKRAKTLHKAIKQKEDRLKPNDFKRIHAYRIANKRLRYALELINPSFNHKFDKRIKRLKAKTDHLGNRCDLYVMQEDLHALLDLRDQTSDKMSSLDKFLMFISSEMTKNEANG
ncbi:MAG: CHAD domain-containing protein [Bacilli bacterium]|nr:CHAD domain-containing protein [Bacilli bacterium]